VVQSLAWATIISFISEDKVFAAKFKVPMFPYINELLSIGSRNQDDQLNIPEE